MRYSSFLFPHTTQGIQPVEFENRHAQGHQYRPEYKSEETKDAEPSKYAEKQDKGVYLGLAADKERPQEIVYLADYQNTEGKEYRGLEIESRQEQVY